MAVDRSARRVALGRLAIFAATLGLGVAAWPLLGAPFSAGFAQAGNWLIAPLEFGKGGRVEFHALRRSGTGGAEDDLSWDVRVGLRQEGSPGTLPMLLNPRRLAYLPFLVFAALIAAAPFPLRRRMRCLALGTPLLLSFTWISVWIVLAWLFSRAPGVVYDWSAFQQTAIELAYEGAVSSLSNRFIAPLALAALLVGWHWERSPEPAQSPAAPDRAPRPRARRREPASFSERQRAGRAAARAVWARGSAGVSSEAGASPICPQRWPKTPRVWTRS